MLLRPTRPALAVASLVAAVLLAGCPAGLARHELHHAVHERSPASFATWWTDAHARAQGTTAAEVRRWLDHDPDRLDAPAARRGRWDLTTDRCSASPDRGPTFDFRWPCIRHDLAWRNVRRLTPTPSAAEATALRRSANQRFRSDLAASCTSRPTWQRAACRALAEVYHGAVQLVA